MSAQFFQFLPKLSQNFIQLLEDNEFYDIKIEVGKGSSVKIFHAHKNILCYRSPYLRRICRILASNNNTVISHIKLPNISPGIFQIILRYIYGGILLLNEQKNIFKILAAADELRLQEIVDYLQNYLIEKKSEWMKQHFELTYRESFQSVHFLKLQQFCTDLIANSPEKIFNSSGINLLSEESLVQLIKRDDLRINEIEIWEHVLKWGLAKNPTLLPDPDTWTNDDFKKIKNTLQHCLPFIRLFGVSSKNFLDKVRPYEKLLERHLYDEMLRSYLDPDIKPNNKVLLPRYGKNIGIGIIDSKIVNLNIVSLIARWIDKEEIKSKFDHFRELYLPYEFKLLLRGSRDGFTSKKFHTLCDNKSKTVTFIKVKGTDEILGGYNPITWSSCNSNKWGKTKDSFIFSFKNKNKFFEDSVISKVENTDHAIYFSPTNGPNFGSDIILFTSDSNDYNIIYCRKYYYEKKIRDTESAFEIDDYEVYQIIRK